MNKEGARWGPGFDALKDNWRRRWAHPITWNDDSFIYFYFFQTQTIFCINKVLLLSNNIIPLKKKKS